MDDLQLRPRAAASGIEDLDGFLEKQRERVVHMCLKILEDPNLADEAAQQVMIKLNDSLHGARPLSKSEYGPWLTTVARNASMDVFRQRKRNSKAKEVLAADLPDAAFRSLGRAVRPYGGSLEAEVDPIFWTKKDPFLR